MVEKEPYTLHSDVENSRSNASTRSCGTPWKKRAILFAAIGAVSSTTACGGPPAATPTTTPTPSVKESSHGFGSDTSKWGTYHSKRFQVSFSLPDGKAWRIDDHSRPSLRAVHEATGSRLELIGTRETDLMNRERCEARARETGFVPNAHLVTVDDEVTVSPGPYDSRVWVAIDTPADAKSPSGALHGHVFLFGAFLRQCLLVHFETTVDSQGEEPALSSRLAMARARIVRDMSLDPPRTTPFAEVPRASAPSK